MNKIGSDSKIVHTILFTLNYYTVYTLKHILFFSYQIHCGGIMSKNNENCVTVLIYVDVSVV